MIEDAVLRDFLAGITTSLDPVERFRAAIGEPDPWQAELLRTNPNVPGQDEDRLTLCLTGRQQGKSTSTACVAYDLFSRGQTVILSAPSIRQATELFRRILVFKDCDRHAPNIVRQTMTELEAHPRHGGRIVVVPASDQACGLTADAILVDEACFVQDDALTALFPMRQEEGRIILLSTPNGRQGYFYETWTSGKRFRRIHARSVDVPRLAAKVAFDRTTMSEFRFRQEHLTEFLSGNGIPLIGWDVLDRASNKGVKALCLT